MAVCSFVGFFLFIGLIQTYQNSVFKKTLPIKWVDSFTPEEKLQIKKSIEWQLLAWQLDHRQAAVYARVEVKRKPWRDAKGQILHGRFYGNRIEVYAGEQMEVPAFYHELCHHLDSGNEHEKGDPRWIDWEKRQIEICNFILASRKEHSK